MKTPTILITGGHLTPAIATIEELHKRDVPIQIVFVGRSHATEHKHDVSHEKEEMSRLHIAFYSITTGRIQRFISFHSLVSFIKIPFGFVQAIFLCIRLKPTCIVSFGGYVALPIVLAGRLLKIPSITHEQTSVMGLANKIIARFATKICVTFQDLLKELPKGKGVYTGLPIREQIFQIKRKLSKESLSDPVIYITGGSTGAVSLNAVVFSLLPELLQKYVVIHQTGRVTYEEAVSYKQRLSPLLQKRYMPYEYISSDDLVSVLSQSTLVVGRSGANTVIELAAVGMPGLFIPLPWSGGGEQLKNAQWLENKGSAKILLQKDMTKDSLLDSIDTMISDISTYQANAVVGKETVFRDGARRFVDEIISIL